MSCDLKKPMDILRFITASYIENCFDGLIITAFCLASRNKLLLILAVYSVTKIINAIHMLPIMYHAKVELAKLLEEESNNEK